MRLIDADAIPWTDLNDDPNSKIRVLVTFADKVNKMPTIEPQPDIIRCGECRHFTTKGNIERVEFGTCLVTNGVCLREDYCSWAKRKEGEKDAAD